MNGKFNMIINVQIYYLAKKLYKQCVILTEIIKNTIIPLTPCFQYSCDIRSKEFYIARFLESYRFEFSKETGRILIYVTAEMPVKLI